MKTTFELNQAAEARLSRRTPEPLKHLIFHIVDQVAKEHYAAAYSMKCLQCSAAVQRLLARASIKSTLWAGAVCAAEVFAEPGMIGWGGFWDKDYHVWLATEFYEYVDLSISQLHHHPCRRRDDGLAIPPVWWSDIERWPCTLTYLPSAPAGFDFTPADHDDLKFFFAKVDAAFEMGIADKNIKTIHFGEILNGPDSMNQLYNQKNPWVVNSLIVQELNIPRPDWIIHRENELRQRHAPVCSF
jgi:hypothetical protein